ncbi:hypothetical protein BU17DRAFT_79716 [Hysterangium stoloniferum]|nr:hypothetical protein BU17DRAFT_79716 [Hysterangium stoloniferum]
MTSPSVILLITCMTIRSPTAKGPMCESPKSNTIPGCGDGFLVEEPSTPGIAVNASGVDRGGGGRLAGTSDCDAEGERPSYPELDPEPDSESEPNAYYYLHVRLRRHGPHGYGRRLGDGCRERLVGLGIRRLHDVVRGEGEKLDDGCRFVKDVEERVPVVKKYGGFHE